MPDTAPAREPRLGVALVIGSDAARVVHVHTDPGGAALIKGYLEELHRLGVMLTGSVSVVAVIGHDTRAATLRRYAVPAEQVDALAELALTQHRTVRKEDQ